MSHPSPRACSTPGSTYGIFLSLERLPVGLPEPAAVVFRISTEHLHAIGEAGMPDVCSFALFRIFRIPMAGPFPEPESTDSHGVFSVIALCRTGFGTPPTPFWPISVLFLEAGRVRYCNRTWGASFPISNEYAVAPCLWFLGCVEGFKIILLIFNIRL